MDDLEAAWDQLFADNATLRWQIGRPAFNGRRLEWSLYIHDPAERPKVGHRSRERTAIAPTQEGVVREAARILREISEAPTASDA